MPILRLNAGPAGLVLNGSPAPALPALQRAARGAGPVIIMIHGFKYDPDCAAYSPHARIFASAPHLDQSHRVQWMRPLGFGNGDTNEGLAIAFGWRARGNLWRAQRSARAAGRHLASVIRELRAVAPERPVHVITHSMGSEVIFEALHDLPAGAVQRIVALTGASYVMRAAEAITTPAGQSAEVFNIASRENDLFDFLFERLIAPPVLGDRAVGVGIDLPNVVNVQLDCPESLQALTQFGGHIAAPYRRICHWSGYTRVGTLRFYAKALRAPETVPLHALKSALPQAFATRWSRMFALRPAQPLLSQGAKPAT